LLWYSFSQKQVNGISLFVAIIAMTFFSGCAFLGSPREEVNQQPNKAVFTSAEPSTEDPDVTPAPQKVPGETKVKPH
jgi:hypothetical protein